MRPFTTPLGPRLRGSDVVFGGGASTTVGTVEAVPEGPAPTPGSTASGIARVVGALPTPRSDAAAVTVAGIAYLVGGYDGINADPTVLATSDGRTFRSVAALAVPVRYPAVAALAGVIYVFGGPAIAGAVAGQPIDTIQMVNSPTAHGNRDRTPPPPALRLQAQ